MPIEIVRSLRALRAVVAIACSGAFSPGCAPKLVCDPADCDPRASCRLIEGGSACVCAEGFEGDGLRCRDVDECAAAPCPIGGVCTNFAGSHSCACPGGTVLRGGACVDPNPCAANPCGPHARCIDFGNDFECACDDGYDRVGDACLDPTPCDPAPCVTGAACAADGFEATCTCPEGTASDGTACRALGPCFPDPCGGGATCEVVGTAHLCACPEGFAYVNEACVERGPCAPDPCGAGATCVVTNGSARCDCPSGEAYVDGRCRPETGDPCVIGQDDCDPIATCAAAGTSYTCACPGADRATTRPEGRSLPMFAFDADRGVTIAFGGRTSLSRTLEDTWSWDGRAWTRLEVTPPPNFREAFDLVHDPTNRRLVLIGSTRSNTYFTAEFTGSAWSPVVTVPASPALGDLEAVHDAARGVIVAYGSGGRTWVLDGTRWSQVANANDPSARTLGLAYDTVRRRVVGFGGQLIGQALSLDETWEFDGTTWRLSAPTGGVSPPGRQQHATVWDPVSQRTLVFGGATANDQTLRWFNDLWSWDGTRWTRLAPVGSAPSERNDPGIAFDAVRQRVIQFGSGVFSTGPAELWSWDGTRWTGLPLAGRACGP